MTEGEVVSLGKGKVGLSGRVVSCVNEGTFLRWKPVEGRRTGKREVEEQSSVGRGREAGRQPGWRA